MPRPKKDPSALRLHRLPLNFNDEEMAVIKCAARLEDDRDTGLWVRRNLLQLARECLRQDDRQRQINLLAGQPKTGR